jgi:hypothetical protein
MGRHALSHPEGRIERQRPPAHDLWQSNLFTGALAFRLEIPREQYVSPATGRLGLVGDEPDDIVAQRAATRAGVPVLPGSGIKGAVRTLYELLSFSCDPFARGGAERCTPQACCDACSLFGLLGYSGRLSFTDAVPPEPGAVQVEVQKVPVPWTPDPSKTPGDFRLYDLQEATFLPPGRKTAQKQPKELAREVYHGAFATRMTFTNVTAEELGRLLLAMGLGTDRNTRFLLRLGGVKYDGKGGVKVAPEKLALAKPRPQIAEGEACGIECADWIGIAGRSPWAATFWPKLEQLAAILRPPSGSGGA